MMVVMKKVVWLELDLVDATFFFVAPDGHRGPGTTLSDAKPKPTPNTTHS